MEARGANPHAVKTPDSRPLVLDGHLPLYDAASRFARTFGSYPGLFTRERRPTGLIQLHIHNDELVRRQRLLKNRL